MNDIFHGRNSLFEKKRQTGQNFEQGAQKPRGASDRRKNDRNPVNVAVYGNAHAMMPLIQGILHAENVERLPPVAKDGMCLLTWMAADGTKAG